MKNLALLLALLVIGGIVATGCQGGGSEASGFDNSKQQPAEDGS